MNAKCTARPTRADLEKLKASRIAMSNPEFVHMIIERATKLQVPEHQSPLESCSCGIYALKETSRCLGDIYGEVYLWGKVIEHEDGWRAQFAYPRSFVVRLGSEYGDFLLTGRWPRARRNPIFSDPPALISKEEIQFRLRSLTSYGVDILLGKDDLNSDTVPLWGARSGYDQEGLDLAWRCLHTPAWWQLEALVSPEKYPTGFPSKG
jgi:hypothetical protein